MKSHRWMSAIGLGSLIGAIVMAGPARAQETEDAPAENIIIVTAQKRASDIQDVPLSVTAVTSSTLEKSGVNTIEAVQTLAPGMNMSAIGSGFVSYTYIRGAGTNVIDAGSDPSVAFFQDEVYLAGTAGLQFDLLDVERVEVLKGPQGTLFGRNAAGGAISIITKRPSHDFDAWAAADAGEYGLFAVRGGITGPLGDRWAYRLSAAHRQRKAFTDNPAGRDPGSIDNYTGRGQIMYDGDDLTVLLTGEFFTSDNGMTNQFISTANTASLLTPAAAAAQPADQSFYRRYYDVDGFEKQNLYAATGRIEWDLGPVLLTSISAWRDNHFKRLQDQDGSIADAYALATDASDKTFSQELRLSGESDRFEWIAGLYYYNGKTERADRLASGPDFAPAPLRNSLGIYGQNIKAISYAAFGQATYEILPALKLTLGARYSKDKKRSNQATDPIGPVAPFTVELTPEWSSFDPAVIVQYEPSRDVMLYGSFRQGFKSGGFQSLPGNLALASTVYAPEDVKSFELGAKTQWFDNRLRLNVALFDTRITNQQILRIPTPGTSIIDNAGRTRTRGIDVALQAAIGDYLHIDWNTTYQHARFREYFSNCSGTPPVCLADFAGNRQLRSPDFQTSFVADLKIPLGGDAGNMTLRGEYSYQTKVFFDAANSSGPGAYQPGYGLLGGRIGYEADDGRWSVALFAKNLTNRKYFRNVAISGLSGVGTPGDPQSFGVSLNWRLR
ncbi:MAG: TonB-dependent receptor [Sphingopyxis sp.]|nr:TonB-dependent receptor [Sphingopyxis sp.]